MEKKKDQAIGGRVRVRRDGDIGETFSRRKEQTGVVQRGSEVRPGQKAATSLATDAQLRGV